MSLPESPPLTYQCCHQVIIFVVPPRVRLTVIPEYSFQTPSFQGMNHRIEQPRGFVLEKGLPRKRRHPCALPVLPHSFQADLLLFPDEYLIGFILHKAGVACIADQANGDVVLSLSEQAGRNGIYTGWVLIGCCTHKVTID